MILKKLLIIISILFVFSACEDRSNLTEPESPKLGDADFTRFASIGNSLTAGMQNGALYQSGQQYSYSKLIADQVGIEFVQPTIDDPGMGGRIEIKTMSPFSTYSQPIAAGFPNNSDYDSTYNNLGIPGAKLSDLLYAENSLTSSDESNLFFNVVLREKGTVLEQIISFQPTLLTLWIGNNDILNYATSGGISNYTNVDTFAVLFGELCSTLSQNEIPVFLGNIPNVQAIPYFTTIGPSIGATLQELQQSDPQITGLYFFTSESPYYEKASIEQLIRKNILITLSGSNAIQYLGNTDGDYYSNTNSIVPENVNIASPFGLSPDNPFPNEFVLDDSEQRIVENVTSSFNATISSNAQKYDFHVVDINALFNEISTNGYMTDGIYFTTEYIFGGIFSLDGIHPTNQGYGIIANKFIEVINDRKSAEIPHLNISTLPGSITINKDTDISKLLPKFDEGIFESIFY